MGGDVDVQAPVSTRRDARHPHGAETTSELWRIKTVSEFSGLYISIALAKVLSNGEAVPCCLEIEGGFKVLLHNPPIEE